MNALAALALIGWIPLSIAAFAALTPRSATLLTVVGGCLFLPVASFDLPGLPDYTKTAAVALGTLVGLLLLARRQFARLRLGWRDLPVLAWCLVPGAAALANGYGIYDAASAALSACIDWGVPYLIGRAVFRDLAALRDLARGVFVGGLVYVPFCLYEVRMSPQLHATVYGFAQHTFMQTIRLDGYRPMVFMDHGLMVALWMAVATVAGFHLWWHGGMRRLAQVPVAPLLLVLGATTVLCKSMGALVLLGAGVATLVAVRWLQSRLPVLVLLGLPLLFVGARLGLDWEAQGPIEFLREYAPERATSLEYRIVCEQVVLADVWRHPWFGASTWGVRAAAADPELAKVVLDSAWLITLSSFGFVGLALFLGVHVTPILALMRRLSVSEWLAPRAAGAATLAVALCMFVCDCMFNSMMNPVYIVALGSLTSVAAGDAALQPGLLLRPQRRRGPLRARRRVAHSLA